MEEGGSPPETLLRTGLATGLAPTSGAARTRALDETLSRASVTIPARRARRGAVGAEGGVEYPSSNVEALVYAAAPSGMAPMPSRTRCPFLTRTY